MSKLHRNQEAKAKTESWLSSPRPNIGSLILYSLIFLLPTQLGIHFWPQFAYVNGFRIDYLSPVIYITDLLILILFAFWLSEKQLTISIFFRKFNFISLLQYVSDYKARLKKLFTTFRTHPLQTILLLISAYLLIKIPFVASKPLALYGLLKLLEMIFFGYYIASNLKTNKKLNTVALIFSVSLIIQSLIAILHYLNQSSLGGVFYFIGERSFSASTPGIANASVNGSLILRPYATFPHPNVLAGFLLTGIVFIFTFLNIRKNPIITLLKFLSLSLASVALMLTLSRVAILIWLALIIHLSVSLIRKQGTAKKRISYAYTVGLIAFLLLLFLNLPSFSRITSSSLFEKSITVRQDLADTALEAITASPLYGIGHFHFLPFRGATAPSDGGLTSIQPVHNIFLLIAAENGIIGLLLFLALIAITLWHIIKNPSSYKTALCVVLLIIVVLGLFDHYWLTIQQGQLLLALFLGLSWAL